MRKLMEAEGPATFVGHRPSTFSKVCKIQSDPISRKMPRPEILMAEQYANHDPSMDAWNQAQLHFIFAPYQCINRN